MGPEEHPEIYQIDFICHICRRRLWSDSRANLREYEEDSEGNKICSECVDNLLINEGGSNGFNSKK